MSKARFNRFVLVWDRSTACSVHEYTAEKYNTEFSDRDRERLLDGKEVRGVVDLEAFYHRNSPNGFA